MNKATETVLAGVMRHWRLYRLYRFRVRCGWEKWLNALRIDAEYRHDAQIRGLFDSLFTGGSSAWGNALLGSDGPTAPPADTSTVTTGQAW